jgi:hypothetical protein
VTAREVLTELRRLRAENAQLRATIDQLQHADRAAALRDEIAMLSQADRFRVREVIAALIAARVKPPLMGP